MKKMTKAMLMTALILGSVQWGGTPVHANELDTFALDEYVVTATRTPVELFNANANISVVTKEQIENRHYQDVREALKEVPGVSFQNYGMAGHSTSQSIYINGSNKVLLLIDGIRISQGNEANPYDLISNMDNIEKIEVLKGSASSLYGADAQGGVVNIITNRTPKNITKMFIEGGSFDTFNFGIKTQGTVKDWLYSASMTRNQYGDSEDGNGNTIEQSNDAKNISFMVGKKLGTNGDKGNITLSYDKNKTDWEYINLYNYDTTLNGTIEKGNSELESCRLVFDYNFDDSLVNKLSVYRNERYIWSDNSTKSNIVSFGVNEQLTKYFGEKHTLTTGIDYYTDKFEDGYGTANNYYGIDALGREIENIAVYVQDVYNFTDKLNFTLGARYDDNDFDEKFTGNAKLGYEFSSKTNAYFGYGTFFNSPTVFALFDKEHGNSSLVPENGYTYELGVNHKFDDNTLIATHFFKRETEDKVEYDWNNYKFVNLDTVEKAEGFDVRLKSRLSDKWDTSIGYTYVKTEAGSNKNNSGYTPKHTVDIGVDYNISKVNANLVVKGIIDRPGLGETSYGKFFPCDNYWLVNLGLNYKADKNHKFYVKVNNLFDKYYAEASAAAPYWGGDGPGDWWAMPGRSFLIGMEYSF